MALKMRVVLDPVARPRVEVHDVGLFAPVAAALPWVHRAAEAGLPGGPARLIEAPVAVKQQGTGEDRHVQVQQREDEQFVPEDVAAIPLSMPAAGGDTG